MKIDTNTIASMTEANQNFSRVARIADCYGEAVIFKNNRPKYRLVDLEQDSELVLTDDEKIDVVAKRLLNEYRPAFLELAK
ncbi:MAG: type II toxin-antitoxin system Phd/YefM family antitoxin [Clostridia bacterium]|nr:type II toxin-antitoxin system Phd/YefM family antitoxin [Clostridia bacterium]MBQ6426503.1 type II toxin-antitoxin system Phd/YefM family antitoxin [Clostridia bacterium]MBR0445528.1 type II toxin-antitoxin system Phd/YefM family antitoxin [Clostridia bacterium]